MIFASADAVELIKKVVSQLKNAPEIIVFGNTNKHTPFSEFLEECLEETKFTPVQVKNLKETAVVYFSSGSTGLPKGICLSHMALLNPIRHCLYLSDLVIFSTSPAYWTTFTTTLLGAVISKSCKLVVPSFDPMTFWKTLENFEVTYAFLSPMHVALLLQGPNPHNYNLFNLRTLTFGGSAVVEQHILKIRSYLPNTNVCCLYGLSEFGTAGLGFNFFQSYDVQLAAKKPTTCGRPMLGFAYKVVDRNTREALGPNRQGELRIKSEYQMNGYYKMDALDEWDSNGFIRTGDVAYYDEDFCFYVTDRIREIFKYQSWQVSLFKNESVLTTHPAIENVVVIGIPHPVDSERATALVVLKKSFVGSVTESEIEDFVADKVNSAHRLRGGVIFVKTVSMTSTGKYRRRYMRELVITGKIQDF